MEKRIFLAIVISIALLFGWSAVAPKLFPELARKPQPPASATATTATTPPPPATGSTASSPAPASANPANAAVAPAGPRAPIAAAAVQRTVIDTADYTAVFSNRGAQLISFKLKNYKQKHSTAPVDLVKAREPNRTDFPFAIVARDAAVNRLNSSLWQVKDVTDPKGARLVEYRYSDGSVTATKTFRFQQRNPYLFEFRIELDPSTPYRVAVGPGIRTLTADEHDSKVIMTGNGVTQTEGKFRIHGREKAPSFQIYPSVDYIGVEDNYFLTALRPNVGGASSLQNVSFYNSSSKVRRSDMYAAVNASSEGVVSGEAFFGPKETKLLDAYNFSEALQLGWFGWVARLFLEALLWINQFTKNYGFAIIVLTILIKIALYPLQHKQNVSMKKMQRVQPKVEAIKAKYKKSRTDVEQRNRMNQEMMQLYQKEGINPMAGCLPLVLQLPILWGFYNLLSRAIELRGAPWILWIHDLSEKDPTYVLPILMTVTMFLQTYIMPATGDPAQRRIFLIMPFIFGFLFKDFPSGLVLYWLVQNILTIIQQLIMNRWWKDHPEETVVARTA